MILDHRPMKVYADNDEVAKKLRKRLIGKTVMSLMPDFYTLEISGLLDEDMQYLKFCKEIKVVGEDNSILALGKIQEIYQRQEGMSEVTTVSFADGMDFWTTITNQSIGKGATVRNSIATVLGSFPLASYMADDDRFFRGQAYLGRLPDVVSAMAKSVHARAYFTQSQVHVVKKGAASSVLFIPDKEIIDLPGFTNGMCIIKTKVKGYPVGLMVVMEGQEKKYRLLSQALRADCWEGDWISELALVDEDEIDNMGSG